MIRLRHETLPAGLSALVRRRADGDLDVIVSAALSASRQRAAVRAGLRAIQPAGRRAGPIPVPALIMLALSGTWLRAFGRLLRLRPAATIAVAATAAVAAVAIAVAPHVYIGSGVPSQGPAGAAQSPLPGAAAGPSPATSRATPPVAVSRPVPTAVPVAAHSPAGAATTPVPAASLPSPATSAPQQTPAAVASASSTPTPPKSGGRGGICVHLLGLWVCA